ncbi:coiled-coil domain-containing protein [Pseudomonas sp. S1_E04]
MPSPSPSVANTVSALFADRPRFETVVQDLLTATLTAAYPGLTLDLPQIQLATPHASGGWHYEPLTTKVLDYLASGAPVPVSELDSRTAYLTQQPPQRLKTPAGTPLDMQRIATLIEELPWSVPIALQSALSDYWNQTGEASPSRWRQLSDTLLTTLQVTVLKQPGLTDLERDTLQQVVNCPDYDQRLARHGLAQTYAYALETDVRSDGQESLLLGPQMLLVRTVDTQVIVLLCKPGGRVERFASIDAFGQYWGAKLANDYRIDALTWRRYEIQGNVFDHQAALILNQQLKSLEALRLPCTLGLSTLQALYAELSDPAQYFVDAPAGEPQFEHLLRPQLPAWLQRASVAQQQAYRQHSLGLAACKILNKGRTFLNDITDIHVFTLDKLRQVLLQQEQRVLAAGDTPAPPERYDPDKVTLTFTHYAGYPGAPGIVDVTHMSLTELALKNLVGQPRGTLTLAHRDGLELPAWLTADFITRTDGLIETVDIGKHYPDFLRQQLLGGTPSVEVRMQLFAEQLRHQLPLQALELHLQQQGAVSATGARYVAALVRPQASARRVDEQAVAIRCLALLRKAEAVADVVANMFIIEPLDNTQGPHLLYRPLYPDALCEFPTREALLDAIAQPGALQTSVLTWLSDEARPIYDNGGFLLPHYVRFGQGDEFSALETPAPARLANDGASNELLQYLLNGQLMQYLYGSNARALVDQASHQSVSTQSSRWEALLETGGVLFNTLLLPLLRGPALLTAWLLTLATSLQRDVPMLGSTDPTTRELAAADVLLNLANVLGELAPRAPSTAPLPSRLKDQALRLPAPRRLPDQWPQPKAPRITEGVVVMSGEFPGERSTALELGFASARQRLTAAQQARLSRLQVPRPAILPPLLYGPRRGLYVLDNQWHVLIEQHLYRLNLLEDGSTVIVDPLDSSRQGPYVKADDSGRWALDLNLRLRGGMPPKRMAAERRRKAQRKVQLTDQYNDFLAQQVALQRAVDVSQSVMDRAEQDPRFTAQQRAGLRHQFKTTLERQTDVFRQLLETLDERIEHGIALRAETVLTLRENTLNNARKTVVLAEQDREQLYAAHRRFTSGGLHLRRVILEHYVSYLAFIKELAEINELSLQSLELKDRQLAALYELGPDGVAAFERLTRDRPENEITALGVAKLQLLSLRVLSIKDAELDLMDGLNAIIDPLNVHVRSHSELRTLELTAVERRETLESLVERYGQALDGLQGLREVNADELETGYFDRLFKLVEKLYDDATQQLASEVKPDPEPVRKPPKRPKIRAGRPQKKLIRTRSGAIVIGDLAPAGSSLPIDVVEVRAEDNNQVIATYSRRDEELWDEVRVVRTPEPPAPARPLNELKGKARKLLRQLDGHLQGAERYKTLCRHPQEIEEILGNEAARLGKAANELDEVLQAQPVEARLAADQRLLDDLRQGVTRLTRKGHELRTALSLELPPTSGNLQFLFDQGLVQVALLGGRIALTGVRKDFIQEYAINDRKGYPLWYAHIHYSTAQTPKADYSVAHLKTAAQRRQSYYTLLDNAQGAQAVVAVHRGMLGKALAERWFLPLAP